MLLTPRSLLLTRLSALALVLFGCSDETCGFEDQTFLGTYERLNGDCPEREPKLFVPRESPESCDQDFQYDDECGVQVVRRCDTGDRGLSVVAVHREGEDYVGTAQYTIYGNCSGLYRVRFTPQ